MKLAILHITRNAIAPLEKIIYEFDPSIDTTIYMDESILKAINHQGEPSHTERDNFTSLFNRAVTNQHDAIMIGCSIFSADESKYQQMTSIPVIGIDQPMIRYLSQNYQRIGILSTTESALTLTVQQVNQQANHLNKVLSITSRFMPEANSLLKAGKKTEYITLIIENAQQLLAEGVEIIVLPQVSLTIAQKNLEELGFPIISSPSLALINLQNKL